MRLENYYDYPGDVVNMASVDNHIALRDACRLFGRPVMGGIPNHGVIVEGTREEVEAQIRGALCLARTAPFPKRWVAAACAGLWTPRTPCAQEADEKWIRFPYTLKS